MKTLAYSNLMIPNNFFQWNTKGNISKNVDAALFHTTKAYSPEKVSK